MPHAAVAAVAGAPPLKAPLGSIKALFLGSLKALYLRLLRLYQALLGLYAAVAGGSASSGSIKALLGSIKAHLGRQTTRCSDAAVDAHTRILYILYVYYIDIHIMYEASSY